MSENKINKELPIYEAVLNKEKNSVISISLTDKPLFGKYLKIEK